MPSQPPPEACAQCGSPVPSRARACPECGADERTGWRESSVYDGLDLPETGEDDGSGEKNSGRTRTGLAWYWWLTAAALLLLLALGALALR